VLLRIIYGIILGHCSGNTAEMSSGSGHTGKPRAALI